MILCENECTRTDGTPYQATHGNYCTRCWAKLDTPLSQAGTITHHLLSNMLTTTGHSDDKIDGTTDAKIPFNPAAFDDATEIYAMLAYWCTVWGKHLDTTPPKPAPGTWRRKTGTIVGLPQTTPEAAAELVTELAVWLRNRLETILATIDYADDIAAFTEQIKNIWRMNARWSQVDRPAYSKMPCPIQDCGKKLAVYPPTFPGDDRKIVCQGGHWFPEDEYEHLVLVFEQVLKERAQVDRVTRGLMEKYGDMLRSYR